MDFESSDQIEICFSRRDEEGFKMEDRGSSLLHYSDAELTASRVNVKERRLLHRSWAKVEADRSYRLRCMQTDLRLAERGRSRLAARSARVRSQLGPAERASLARLDAAGKLRLPTAGGPSGGCCYRRPAHLEPAQLIGSAQRRLDAGGSWTAVAATRRRRRNEPPASELLSVRFYRCDSDDGDGGSGDESDASTSTTESLRELRAASVAARRPQTAATSASGASASRRRLASQSCQGAFFTGDRPPHQSMPMMTSSTAAITGRRHPLLTTPRASTSAAVEAQQRDRLRWADAERRKLRELDRPVREFLRSLAELRV